MDLFIFNNDLQRLEINEYSILLIKEFAALWNEDRNKCKEDPKGIKRLRAYREFAYIYLALDYKSPYFEYLEQEKHQAAMEDSGLTEKEFNDETFRAACRKYRAIQDENMAIKCLHAAKGTIHKFIDYFTDIDPQERDQETGKPIYKVKDIMSELTKLNELFESFKALEYQVKKEKEQESSNRAGEVDGFQPNFNQ